MSKELDLTQGSVSKVLLQFAVPFLLANLLQALYGGVDLFIVGLYDDAASVAGVAIGSQVMQTVIGVVLGLTAGAMILIAMGVGARDYRRVASTIGTSICFFGVIGVVLTLLMAICYENIAVVMHTPPEAMDDTLHYILVGAFGIPFTMGYNVVCGILRGLGDSRSPLYFVGIACAINIVLDFVLVGGLGMRAMGAAVATVTSQGISLVIAICYLYRRGFNFEFSRKDIGLNRVLSKKIVLLGAPIALQDALINISFLIITVIVNQMGIVAAASLGVVEKIIVFAMLPPFAISSAVATMTAQNYGAGLVIRMKQCLTSGILVSLIFGASFCVYAQFLPETLTCVFSNDSAVIEMAAGYLRGYSIDCVLVCFVFCINSYFSGQGNSCFPMIHSVIATFLFRIPLSFLSGWLSPDSLVMMGYAPPFATLVSLVICIWYLRLNSRKLMVEHLGR